MKNELSLKEYWYIYLLLIAVGIAMFLLSYTYNYFDFLKNMNSGVSFIDFYGVMIYTFVIYVITPLAVLCAILYFVLAILEFIEVVSAYDK